MTKIRKPRGLISYNTLDGTPLSLGKPRSFFYLTAIFIILSVFIYALKSRQTADFTIIRGAGLPYSKIKNEKNEDVILNQFKIHIQNQGNKVAVYQLELEKEFQNAGFDLTVAENPLRLGPNSFREWFFFVRLKPEDFKKLVSQKIKIQIQDLNKDNNFSAVREVTLVGPVQ